MNKPNAILHPGKVYIERKADAIRTPYGFLQWYLGQWHDNQEVLDLEGSLIAYLTYIGVERATVWIPCDPDGYIKIEAGVQSTVIKPPPQWIGRFSDGVGWKKKHLEQRVSVVSWLIDYLLWLETDG